MDTWLLLRNTEYNGERNRTLFVLKSRGMHHSNQVREFVLTSKGIALIDVYLGSDRVLTGTARMVQSQKEAAAAELRERIHQLRQAELAGRRKALEAQIAALEAENATAHYEAEFLAAQNREQIDTEAASSLTMARARNGRRGAQEK
jgi:circadian clock protein KaiC